MVVRVFFLQIACIPDQNSRPYSALVAFSMLAMSVNARLGNPFGIPQNSAIIPISDLLDSGIFI